MTANPRDPSDPVIPIEPRLLELIHAEIDGLNSRRQRAELDGLLALDARAREYFEQMRALAEALGGARSPEPPPGLHHDILRSIRSAGARRPDASGARDVPAAGSARRAWPSVLRYGYAFAAGVILTISALQWYGAGGPVNPSSLSGTMTSPERPEVVSRIPLGPGRISGTIQVTRAEGGAVVALDLDAGGPSGPARIEISFDPADAAFLGFSQSGGARDLRASVGAVSWEATAHHVAEVRFVVLKGGGTPIELRISPEGEPPQALTIRLPGSP